MGEVVNDLSVLAKQRQIAVITANQLNRAAYEVIDPEREVRGKQVDTSDAGRKINNTHISESQLVIENCDVAFVINKEYNKITERDYLSIKFLKNRDKERSLGNGAKLPPYFVTPFEVGNGMRLEEDFEMAKGFYSSLESISSVVEDAVHEKPVHVKLNGGNMIKGGTTAKKGGGMKARAINPETVNNDEVKEFLEDGELKRVKY